MMQEVHAQKSTAALQSTNALSTNCNRKGHTVPFLGHDKR